MAFKKKMRKTKKSFKRKNRSSGEKKNAVISVSPQKSMVDLGYAFPAKIKIKMKYTDTVSITSTLGVIQHYQMAMNGVYDPNLVVAGHQPLYFDQCISIWNHFHVIGSKMTVRFIPLEANTVPTSVIVWLNDDQAVVPTSTAALQEQTKSNFTIIGSDGGNYTTLQLNYSPKKTFGGSILGNIDLQGSISGNPVDLSVGYISVIGADNATTVSVIAQIVVEYIVIFSELKDIGSS